MLRISPDDKRSRQSQAKSKTISATLIDCSARSHGFLEEPNVAVSREVHKWL